MLLNLFDSQENYKSTGVDSNETSNNSAFLQFYNFIVTNSSAQLNSSSLRSASSLKSSQFLNASYTRANFKHFYEEYVCNCASKLVELLQLVFFDLLTFIVDFWSKKQNEFSFEYKIFLFLLIVLFTLLFLISTFWYIFKEKLESLTKFQGKKKTKSKSTFIIIKSYSL